MIIGMSEMELPAVSNPDRHKIEIMINQADTERRDHRQKAL